jgi:GT2 family glycosyltransferase
VIVDNASPNSSGEQLKKDYENVQDITVIINEKNLGFANGNNIGFIYAKYELHAEYIVLLNADTRILIKDFGKRISEIYEKYSPGVVGPLILSGDGKLTSNPMRYKQMTVEKVDEFLIDYKIRLWCLENGLIGQVRGIIHNFICRCKAKIKRIVRNSQEGFVTLDYIRPQINYTLHGSFMIFTPIYIEKFDGLDDATFMYCEEDILYNRCMKNGVDILYHPSIMIYHYEGGSTEVGGKFKEKKIFFFKNSIDSLKVLRSKMEEKL